MTERSLKSLYQQVNGLLTMDRLAKTRSRGLERRIEQLEQAILELDAALRRSGVIDEGTWVLSLQPSSTDPDRPSADQAPTIPA